MLIVKQKQLHNHFAPFIAACSFQLKPRSTVCTGNDRTDTTMLSVKWILDTSGPLDTEPCDRFAMFRVPT